MSLLGGAARRADAQATACPECVKIGLRYDPNARPGVLVLPVGGEGGDSVRAILQRDLDYGDRVTVLPAGAEAAQNGSRFNYPLLAQLGAAAVVQASVLPGGQLRVALHDVAAKRVVETRTFPLPGGASAADWRMRVHGVSDEIEGWITGVRGIASTRIAYVKDGMVHVVDSDGENGRPLTTGGGALSPSWHPTGRSMAYSILGTDGTEIVVRDLASGNVRRVSAPESNLNITPTFSPDGNTLVYASGDEQGTDLVAVSAANGGGRRRVTIGRGTDNVSPSFSPDGRRIAFTSGRAGHPEVYITDVDGTNAELLTPFNFGDQSYRSNPDWSPDGRSVAFQSQLAGAFQIMTINLRDRSIKQHTSDGSNEDPSWAPDGRHLVFTSNRSGSRQIWVVDAESGRMRQLTRGTGGARLAAWSPSLGRAATPGTSTANR
jgi:TolB protein